MWRGPNGMACSACRMMPHATSATPRTPARNATALCNPPRITIFGGCIRMARSRRGIAPVAWFAMNRTPASRAMRKRGPDPIRQGGMPPERSPRTASDAIPLPRQAKDAWSAMKTATIYCFTQASGPPGRVPLLRMTSLAPRSAATSVIGQLHRSFLHVFRRGRVVGFRDPDPPRFCEPAVMDRGYSGFEPAP